jgi:hypothetical protein
VIRFSAFLVAVAVALLVAGVVTSRLALVYVAIGVSGVSLLALGTGVLIKRNELFGKQAPAEPELARPGPAVMLVPTAQPAPQVAPQAAPQVAPWEATVPAASAWPAAAAPPAPSRAGYLPTEQPPPYPAYPADRPADVPRRPAAFVPRPAAAPPPPAPPPPAAPSPAPGVPAPAPGVPAPAPGTWEWRPDAPATQPFREVPRPSAPAPAAAVPDEPSVQDELPAQDESPAPAEQPADGDLAVQQHLSSEQEPPAEPVTLVAPQPEPATQIASVMPEPAAAAADLQREVTVVPGVPRYHHPHCLLIRFMGEGDLGKMTLGAARDAGCTPCRACLPDQPEDNSELGPPEPERQGEIALDVLPRRRLGLRTRPGLDRQDLIGDQPRVFGQGRGHLRVI